MLVLHFSFLTSVNPHEVSRLRTFPRGWVIYVTSGSKRTSGRTDEIKKRCLRDWARGFGWAACDTLPQHDDSAVRQFAAATLRPRGIGLRSFVAKSPGKAGQSVILSAAKDLCGTSAKGEILRYAQDDRNALRMAAGGDFAVLPRKAIRRRGEVLGSGLPPRRSTCGCTGWTARLRRSTWPAGHGSRTTASESAGVGPENSPPP
jgi:hypothetical protein